MKVSIVTSVLNGSRFLPRCINSVYSQTYPCEHVIVDGGSTDGSQDIVRSVGSYNVHFINAPGTGISEAFNLGIQESSGDIIAILNADDWLEKDAAERSVQALNCHPDIGFTYGSIVLHTREFEIMVYPKCISDDLNLAAKRQMLFYHISSFVRSCVYTRHGLYDIRYKVAMDFDFYARIISRGVGGVFVPGIIAHATAGGLSSDIWTRSIDYYNILSKYHGSIGAGYYVSKFAINSYVFRVIFGNPYLWNAFGSINRRQRILTSR